MNTKAPIAEVPPVTSTQPVTSCADLADELRSSTCRCGKEKSPMETFCWTCFHVLPPLAKMGLYQPLGGGYIEARNHAADLIDQHTAD